MQWTEQKQRAILGLAIAAFVVAVSVVGFQKYEYRYQGLDLAIYTNVLWNLSHPTPSNSPSLGEGEKKIISPHPTGSGSPPFSKGEQEGVRVQTRKGGEGGWRDWYSSIQGSSYLGDHVEPVLLFLVPFFRFWSDPRLLIILQALALGLTAIPVYLLLKVPSTKHQIPNNTQAPNTKLVPTGVLSFKNWKLFGIWNLEFGISVLWLLNPLLWNSAFFEFHALAFAPVLVLTVAYFFKQRKFWWFCVFAAASVLVREDIALVIAMFGIIAFLQKYQVPSTKFQTSTKHQIPNAVNFGNWILRVVCDLVLGIWNFFHRGFALRRQWHWIIVPLLLGIGWFAIATAIASAHNMGGAYKFLAYYSWIMRPEFFGHPISGFTSVAWGVLSQPLKALVHLATIGNMDMLLGLLMPFAFLPLLRPKWLILAIPPALQILLSGTGGNELVITLHYNLLFIPALVLATRDGLNAWLMVEEHPNATNAIRMPRMREWLERCLPHFPRRLAIGIGVGWVLAVAVAIGPFQGIANLITRGASADDRARRAAYDELLARIPADASVAASYAALPRVAARRSASNLEYVYLGVTQFAEAAYELSNETAYLLIDARDARAYAVQFRNVAWARPHAAGGAERLRKIIMERGFRVIAERNDIALLARDASGSVLDDRYLESKDVPRGALRVDALRDIRLIEQ